MSNPSSGVTRLLDRSCSTRYWLNDTRATSSPLGGFLDNPVLWNAAASGGERSRARLDRLVELGESVDELRQPLLKQLVGDGIEIDTRIGNRFQ